jgi:two-component system, OmpR family, response regulator
VLNRDQLIDLVKGREWAGYDRVVDTQVMRLRKKTEADPSNSSLIKTVRGSGYVFAAAVGITLPSTNVRSPGSYGG